MADDNEEMDVDEPQPEPEQAQADADLDVDEAPAPVQAEEAEPALEPPPPSAAPAALPTVSLAQVPDAPEPEPVPEEPRYIEPLGVATSQTLLQNDLKPYVLEKMFREGSMGRIDLVDGKGKAAKGGSTLYEDYQWQLEKLYRQVPESMSLGNIRLKPEALMYEEERWVLGKMFRELGTDYYEPKAEPKPEDVIETSEAIEVNRPFPNEPKPCFPPPTQEDECCCPQQEEKPCGTAIMGSNGKVYEFAFSGLTAVQVDSALGDDCSGANAGFDQFPMAALNKLVPPGMQDLAAAALKEVTSMSNLKCTASTMAAGASSQCARINANATAGIPTNAKCEARIDAVCKAARNAMAIYDTLTGTDNFPCNLGDREDAENAEDNVWGWLYQAILKMVPCDDNQNPPLSTSPSKALDENRPDDMC